MKAEHATELIDRAQGRNVIRKFLLPAVAVLLAVAATPAMGATRVIAGAEDNNEEGDYSVYAIGL